MKSSITPAIPVVSLSRRDRWKQLRQNTSILQVLEAAGVLATSSQTGHRLVGPCPIHRGDNPRAFSANLDKNLWFCFTRCHRGGNALELAWELRGRSWPETARWLQSLAGHSPVGRQYGSLPTQRTAQVIPEPTFRPFGSRVPLEAAHPFLRERGLTADTARAFEAGAYLGGGFLRASIAVRLHDLHGRPLGYAARRLDPDDLRSRGKWAWPPGFPKARLLYNWHRALPHLARGLIVVEGVWSVMKLAQAGFPNAVALGGTAISSRQAELLSHAWRILLLLDGDEVGRIASAHHRKRLLHPKLLVGHPPQDLDPAELSEAQLRQLVGSASGRFQPAP